jgi:[acyl-carrier-protein] S-malonyltransferase
VDKEEEIMKIAMVFPGYGSQFVGMGKELYDEFRIVQEYFEEASSCLNQNFVKLCFASSDAELGKLSHAYTTTFLVSSALFALLKQEQIMPDVVAGYNNGEYGALFAAEGLSFPDILYLLSKYTVFYQETLDHMNVALIQIKQCSSKELEDICLKVNEAEHPVYIAIYHDPTTHVVVGDYHAIEHVRDLITRLLPMADIENIGPEVGLHSPLMNEVVEQFKVYLEKVDCKDLKMPLIGGIDGHLISDHIAVKDHIIRHVNSPVRWTRVMDRLGAYDMIIEIGPGTMLSTMLKKLYPDKKIVAINKRTDIEELTGMIER